MGKEKTCYLCGCDEAEKLDGVVRDNPALEVLQCKNCSLVFLSSFEHIKDGFYENDGMFGGSSVDVKKWLESTKDDDKRRFKFLKKEIKDKKVLDFGCGNGGFLINAQKTSQKAAGIELQKSLAEFYAEKGLEVASDIEHISEKFDFITMFHVLEHIKDPTEILQKLGSKLTPDGQIIIEVPNSNDALISIYKNYSFMNFTYWSCHLYLFNEQTLSSIIENAGFKLNYLKHVQRYSFTNHLWWQFFKKPGGHKKLWFLNCKVLNHFYEKSLARLNATDTIIASISK